MVQTRAKKEQCPKCNDATTATARHAAFKICRRQRKAQSQAGSCVAGGTACAERCESQWPHHTSQPGSVNLFFYLRQIRKWKRTHFMLLLCAHYPTNIIFMLLLRNVNGSAIATGCSYKDPVNARPVALDVERATSSYALLLFVWVCRNFLHLAHLYSLSPTYNMIMRLTYILFTKNILSSPYKLHFEYRLYRCVLRDEANKTKSHLHIF